MKPIQWTRLMAIGDVGGDKRVTRRCPSCIVSMDCPAKTFYASTSFSYSYMGLKLYVFQLAIVKGFSCIAFPIFRSLSSLCVYPRPLYGNGLSCENSLSKHVKRAVVKPWTRIHNESNISTLTCMIFALSFRF